MEYEKVNSEEIKKRIANATTAEELFSIAKETGEELTDERALEILQSNEKNRKMSSENDLSDEELIDVVGGAMGDMSQGGPEQTGNCSYIPIQDITYVRGNYVALKNYYNTRCKYWTCPRHPSGGGAYKAVDYSISVVYTCASCGTPFTCESCLHHTTGFLWAAHYCYCPQVKSFYGL